MRAWRILAVGLAVASITCGTAFAQRTETKYDLKQLRLKAGLGYRSLNDYQAGSNAGLRNGFGFEAEVEGRFNDNVSFGFYASGSMHDFYEGEVENIPFSVWYVTAWFYLKYYTPPIKTAATYIKVGIGGTGIAEPDEQVALGKGATIPVGWGVDFFIAQNWLLGAGFDVQFDYFLDTREQIRENEILVSYNFRFISLTVNFDL